MLERSKRIGNEIVLGSKKSVIRNFLLSSGSLNQRTSSSPILLISSGVTSDSASATAVAVSAVDETCRKVQYYTSMEMGLRTVPATVTSAFPTLRQVNSTLEFMKRTGVATAATNTIVAVGSGAAMDLAKAIQQRQQQPTNNTILVPSTFGGILASTSSLPLLLDTTEEALVVPSSSQTFRGRNNEKSSVSATTNIIVETDSLAQVYKQDAIWACCAIAIDAIYRGQQQQQQQEDDDDNRTKLLNMATNAAVDETDDDSTVLSQALLNAGKTLSFGVEEGSTTSASVRRRSSPLALATSLIPTSFPNVPLVTFMASLLPGIVQVMGSGNDNDRLEQIVQDSTSSIPSLASLMVHADGAQSVPTLMSHVKSNRALWNCVDVPDDVLEAILHYSLNR